MKPKPAQTFDSLLARYNQMMADQATWSIPWVWRVFYTKQHNGYPEVYEEETVIWTINVVLAAMIFEEQKLPVEVRIIGISMVCSNTDFQKIINNEI